jgi:Ca2+-binding RTX toxin-like protein
MATLVKHDLQFILAQILISEAHPDGSGTFEAGSVNPLKIPTLVAPWGLRTVLGDHNNLVTGQSLFGAADTLFPRLTPAEWKNERANPLNDERNDLISFDINGPAPGGVVTLNNTNYDTGGNAVQQNNGGFFLTSDVVDADPRTVSNLIADQSLNNPAAIAAWQQRTGQTTMPDADQIDIIENTAPDVGLSAPFNAWFTFFGQFFDHGLDLVTKGGNGTVYIPLAADDPLRTHGPDGIAGNGDEVPASRAFMAVTRATQFNGAARDTQNTTTSFVDQNQTYTSHPSHQAFLREYVVEGTTPISTGKLLDGAIGTMPTWGELKTHIASTLGFRLTDYDVVDAPLLATDAYGNLVGPDVNGNLVPLVESLDGRARLVISLGADGVLGGSGANADTYLAGNPAANGGTGVAIPAGALRTGHAFLNDISHTAGPFFDHDRNPATPALPAAPDGAQLDALQNPITGIGDPLGSVPAGQYDNELLNAHYVTGDGRGNENIGLTTVHHVFHSEHNRQVEAVKQAVIDELAANGPTPVVLGYLRAGADLTNGIQPDEFDGSRLFQAARFATEMQYQHLVFEEFGRKILPSLNIFSGYHTSVDPTIVAEFAHTVYRFGHSMLTNTIDRIGPDGTSSPITLIDAFLDPVEYARTGIASGATGVDIAGAAAGAIIRGVTQQVGNEIDEFVVDSLRNNLLGLPLDLPAINIARGRDTGIPSLNSARRTFFAATNQEAALKPYETWEEFGRGLRHPESLVNFIAAYGMHTSVTSAVTMEEKRNAAKLLVNGDTDINGDGILDLAPVDRLDFMWGSGAWANVNGRTVTGLDDVDFWMGGLAERPAPFGGMLGSTFAFVFEVTLENLQNGDRFYYLSRNVGLNFLHELEANSFAALIMRNTTGIGHLPADVFSTPTYIFEAANLGTFGAIPDDPATPFNESELLIRTLDDTIVYTGIEHVVLGGTAGNDRMTGSEGDDSLWGDGGNDRLEGGAGNDSINGGDGNDILTDSFGDDVLKGGAGNDVINSGPGLDLVLAGGGHDFAMGGNNEVEFFGGNGNDFILGGSTFNTIFGNEGDDWIEGGDGADLLQGDNGDPFQQSSVTGHDVIIGGGGNDDYDTESGDDIMVAGAGVERNEGMLGFDWVTYQGDTSNGPGIGHEGDMTLLGVLPPAAEDVRDRFDLVEGMSGGAFNDILKGDNTNNAADGIVGHELSNDGTTAGNGIGRIAGLQGMLNGMTGVATTLFNSGNIILGGDGNDLIEGRRGDDLIDGNKYLNVRLSWIDQNNIERFSDSMTDPALQAAMFSGAVSPSQLKIVREILSANPLQPNGQPDINTAVYNDVATNYSVVRNTARGTLTVTDNAPLTAGLDSNGVPLGPNDEGSDTLRNIQQLRFIRDANADGLQDLGTNGQPLFDFVSVQDFGPNSAAQGAPTINDTTPTQNQILTAARLQVTDTQGINAASIQYVWQVETAVNSGVYTNALSNSPTFTPSNSQVGLRVRVVMNFEDNRGFLESRTSNATAVVANVNDAPSGTNATKVAVEDVARAFTVADFGFIDPDAGDTLNAVRIDSLSMPAGSSLRLNGVAVTPGTLVTAAQIPTLSFLAAPNANGQSYAEFSYSVRDQAGAFDPSPNILRFNVTPVNDAPNGTNKTVTIPEDTFHVFTPADFGFTDVDAGDALRSVQINNPPAGLTYNGVAVANGAVFVIDNTFAGRLRYTPPVNASGAAVASFTFSVRDLANLADPSPATMTIAVEQGNDAPIGLPTINDTTPTEGAPITASVASIVDPDGITAGTVFTYEWQSSANGTTWNTVVAPSTVTTFTPAQALVGQQLRVVVRFTDALGNPEIVTSNPTTMVGDFYTGNNNANVRDLTNGADVANGNAGNDVLGGLDGDDILNGDGGDDQLNGGNGNDTLDGGAGNDTVHGGAGDDILRGGAGTTGADTLIGGTGADNMTGGPGNDLYDVDNTGDVIVEVANGGIDTVQTSLIGFSLLGLAEVENLSFAGTETVNFSGTGNALANVITGGEGNDTLSGGSGTADGADTLIGGLGDDTYVVDRQGEVTEAPGEGNDTVLSNVTYSIAGLANIENITLTGNGNITAIGNTSANVLTGNGGNNTLDGGAGNDTMVGGAGSDTYVVDSAQDITTEGANAGTDTIQTSLNTFSLATRANIENLSFTGTGVFTGTGNDLANTIVGGAGNDVLDGGLGADSMDGGLGNDTYRVDQTADVVGETAAGGGVDLVQSTANSYTLTNTNIENLTFVGTGAFTGIGNGVANVIRGGASGDTLDGQGGNDFLHGGAGNDSLIGGTGTDSFVFAPGFGSDTVSDFDFDPLGGQDRLDLSGLGITAANFAARVSISPDGAPIVVTIANAGGVAGGIINLPGVTTGVAIDDFVLA